MHQSINQLQSATFAMHKMQTKKFNFHCKKIKNINQKPQNNSLSRKVYVVFEDSCEIVCILDTDFKYLKIAMEKNPLSQEQTLRHLVNYYYYIGKFIEKIE